MKMESTDAAKQERPQSQDGPYVIKRLALWQRFLSALLPASVLLFIAIFLAAYLLLDLHSDFQIPTIAYVVLAVILVAVVGELVFATWYLWNKKEVREIEAVSVPPSRSHKLTGYIMFFLGVLVPGLMVAFGPAEGQTFGAAIIALMVLVGAGVLFLQPAQELTDAARNELKSTHHTSPEKVDTSDDSGEGFLEGVGTFLVGLFVWALIAAALVVPIFFAPWWAVVIIWLLIFILLK